MSLKSTLILVLLFVNVSAFAASTGKFNLSVGLSYENSDNILLSPTNKLDENILHTLLSTGYQKESATFSTNFVLNADSHNYQNHSYSNYVAVSSLFTLTSTLSKRRLFWDILNRFDRVQTDQALAYVPTNQQNANYFATGPRFVFFENPKDSLNADIRYEKLYTETSDSDYNGSLINTAYIRNITRTTSLGLTITYNDRNFDNQILNTDYTRTDISLNLKKRMKLSELQIDAGKTRLDLQNAENEYRSLFRARYEYQLGEKTKLNINYRRELSDFSSTFSTGTVGTATYTNVSSAIFLVKEGLLAITRNFGSSSIRYGYNYVNNDYSDDLLDIITATSNLTFSNRIGPLLNMNLSGTYRDIDYTGMGRRDTARIYSFELIKSLQNLYDLTFNIQYTDNGSTNSNFIYNERRVSIGGHYYFR